MTYLTSGDFHVERRIEVRLEALWGEAEGYCDVCSMAGVAEGSVTVDTPPTLEGVLHAAEMAGLDLHREFRMLPHLALDYVEFWQVPTPVPNEAWAQQPVLEATS